MNNDLREQVKLRIPVYKSKKYGEAPVLTDKMIDELISLIRTATLDAVIKQFDTMEGEDIYRFIKVVEQLKDKDNDY